MLVDITSPIYGEKVKGVHSIILRIWHILYFGSLFVDLGLCYIFIISLEGFVIIIIITDIILFVIQIIFSLQLCNRKHSKLSYYSLFAHNLISLLAFFLRLFVYLMKLRDIKQNDANRAAKKENPEYEEKDTYKEPHLGIIVDISVLLLLSILQTIGHIVFLFKERKRRKESLRIAQEKITSKRINVSTRRITLNTSLASVINIQTTMNDSMTLPVNSSGFTLGSARAAYRGQLSSDRQSRLGSARGEAIAHHGRKVVRGVTKEEFKEEIIDSEMDVQDL